MTVGCSTPLALLGGESAFDAPLHVGRPNMRSRERFLDGLWFTNNGPYVQKFERRVRECCGVAECVATYHYTVVEVIVMVLQEREVVIEACARIDLEKARVA